jgi:restriction system protein
MCVINAVSPPTFDSLMNPLLEGLRSLGGSATIEEMVDKVAEIAELTDDQLQIPHGNGSRSEVEYRLAWTRTYLKNFGLLENSSRGVWSLTPKGRALDRVDPRQVVRAVVAMSRSPATGMMRRMVFQKNCPN